MDTSGEKPGSSISNLDSAEVLRMREGMLARREAELSQREQVLLVRQEDVHRHAHNLMKLERELKQTNGQPGDLLTETIRKLEEQLAEAKRENARLSARGNLLEKKLKEQEERLGATPDETSRLKDLQARERELYMASEAIEERRDELNHREAALIERESKLLNAPDISEREAELAGLIAAQQGRERELNRQIEQFKQREEEWLTKVADQFTRSSEMEEQLRELAARKSELDRRESAMQALEEQLQTAQATLQEQQLQLEQMKSEAGTASPQKFVEQLPPYLSDVSILKSDQIKLQERVLAGTSTSADDLSSNVLF